MTPIEEAAAALTAQIAEEQAIIAAITAKLTGEVTPGLRFRRWDGSICTVRNKGSADHWWVIDCAGNHVARFSSVENEAQILKNLI